MTQAKRARFGPRRIVTYLTLLAGMVALVAAMGFFVLRDEHPALAVALGRAVWVGLIVVAVGGGGLTLVGALQALFGAGPEEQQDAGG